MRAFSKEKREKTFGDELEELLNKYPKENRSDTPNFVLRKYLVGCLAVFNEAVRNREEHYGRRESRAERCKRSEVERGEKKE